jgi:SAM-dependent methyltransferase
VTAKVVRDATYGFLRIDPTPTAEEVDRYYADEFYARADTKYANDSSLDNMREEAEFHRRSYGDLLHLVERACLAAGRSPAQLSVADIGCGFGYWLKFLQDAGIAGYGVEPVREGVDHCHSLGIEAFRTPIEALSHPPRPGRVQLVTMLNVLEHLREPAWVLEQLRENWLADDGYLLLRVPNDFNAWQVTADRLHSLDQWWVVPPRHLNYFSAQSLADLLSACGYTVVDRIATFPLELFLLMGEVYVGDPVLGKQCHRKRVAFERNLDDADLQDLRRRLYREFAGLGLGREIIMLAEVGPHR